MSSQNFAENNIWCKAESNDFTKEITEPVRPKTKAVGDREWSSEIRIKKEKWRRWKRWSERRSSREQWKSQIGLNFAENGQVGYLIRAKRNKKKKENKRDEIIKILERPLELLRKNEPLVYFSTVTILARDFHNYFSASLSFQLESFHEIFRIIWRDSKMSMFKDTIFFNFI